GVKGFAKLPRPLTSRGARLHLVQPTVQQLQVVAQQRRSRKIDAQKLIEQFRGRLIETILEKLDIAWYKPLPPGRVKLVILEREQSTVHIVHIVEWILNHEGHPG